ncbi:MAG: PKD domain-containing protein, partial [Thermoplasmata archaeon]
MNVAELDGYVYLWIDNNEWFFRQPVGGGAWEALASPANFTKYAALVAVGPAIYLVGWKNFPSSAPILFAYDPPMDEWEERAPPTQIRCNHGAVSLRGLLVAISGETCSGQNGFLPEVEAYDPRTDTWIDMPPIPTPRDEFASGVVGDCIYTAGGSWYDHVVQFDITELYCAPLAFDWDFGDGGTVSGEQAIHAYASPGTYTVTLTVTDPLGAMGVDSLVVTVTGNQPPVASLAPITGTEGSPITLDASGSSDPDGAALEYRWDFDANGSWDTAWSSEPTTSFVYGDDYTGKVRVQVSDGTSTDMAEAPATVSNVDPSVTVTPSFLGCEPDEEEDGDNRRGG